MTTEQRCWRDVRVFELLAVRGGPVVWNLGCQREPDGSIPKVLETLNNPNRARAARYLGPAR